MCWEKRIAQHSWIKEYYIKEKDFKVRCREESCKTIIRYASISDKFKVHMFKEHQKVYIYEEVQHKNKNNEWKYFRFTKENKKECILCSSIEFSSDSLSEHVKSHLKKQKIPRHYQYEIWPWKYLKQFGDFSAKCKLCVNETESVYKLHLYIQNMKEHTRKHIKKGHKIYESPAKYSYWKYPTEKHYFLNKCYTKPVNFRTECRFCKRTFEYVEAISFKCHTKKHTFICNNEQSKEMPVTNNENWPYFRFTKQQVEEEIECIICKETLQNECHMKNHIEKSHSRENLELYQFPEWEFKYVKQEEDIVKCTICEESIELKIPIYDLLAHISDQHKEDNDRIEQEEKFWNLQTEKNSWLQECYIDVGDFQAKCKFCEYKEIYIKKKQFEEHVMQAHAYIHYLETEWRRYEVYSDQWKCIRYTDKSNIIERETECMICEKIVSNFLQLHFIHSPQELKSYSHHWSLKYAKQNGMTAKCTICEKDVNFDCDMDNLKDHISSVHLEEWKRILKQRTAYQAGPSISHAS